MNGPECTKIVLERRSSDRELKAYCYNEGFCVSALSIEHARRYIGELLPWPHTEMDAALVREIAEDELDGRWHFFWDKKWEDERACSFRQELERRMEQGETEPDTFYDQMSLIPERPSYGLHDWIDIRHGYKPHLNKSVWTTDGETIVRGACHNPYAKPILDDFYWLAEDGSPP